MNMEFEEVEMREAAQFNKHHSLTGFPFTNLISLAFVDSFVSAAVAGRNTEPSQPITPWLRCGILASVGGRVRAERRG